MSVSKFEVSIMKSFLAWAILSEMSNRLQKFVSGLYVKYSNDISIIDNGDARTVFNRLKLAL